MADTQLPGISWRNPAAFGAGSVTQIGQRLRNLSATRVLLVSDEGLKAALHAGEAADRLHPCRFARRHLPACRALQHAGGRAALHLDRTDDRDHRPAEPDDPAAQRLVTHLVALRGRFGMHSCPRAPGVQLSMIPELARHAQLSAATKDNTRPLSVTAAALYEEMI
jgi:alcohol dehydrogenase class IV